MVTDANANVVEKRLFDAWGAVIKVENGAGTTLAGLTVLDRGYTGHEHLQSVGLINMNARLYDPMLRRFLQVDNYIQDPTNTQNYNQYGYVFNNPLLYIDPSGNVSQGGGGDCKGCGIGVGPGDQTGTSFDIDQFIKDYGIDKWWRKNINGDKISKWWKSKVSFNNIFGGKKDSGPPPNLSTYASLSNFNLTGGISADRTSANNGIIDSCPNCLDPSTIGHNLVGSYPGGDNPKSYNGEYNYSYVPKSIAEYPAIGHDRRYDRIHTAGFMGLFTDSRAIGADWKFVKEELEIALDPVASFGTKERLKAGGLGFGLGFLASFKTILTLGQPGGYMRIKMWYIVSNVGVNNTPTVHKH